MLKTRIITGLVLAFTALIAIYLLPIPAFALFFWFVGMVAAYEYAGLAGIERKSLRYAYGGIYSLLVIATHYEPSLRLPGLFISAAIWAGALICVFAYPRSGAVIRPLTTGVVGIFISWASWIALMVIREAPGGSNWLLWMVLVVAFADIGAYFSGRQFGKRKLAPEVSPGKTWEGFWGGMLISSLICGGILVAMGRFNGGWIFIMILLVTVSVVGDLFESVLKRERGVKDSGVILPGHGGALDRIDSAVAVLPYFALILIYGGLAGQSV
ncbi:MAG: phosphatidate cytidylyltransferase [Gammaproteobacteria bacterium]|jgi:phosphatidate cytidylyltransferase|nr:MAG: phosphatidate cytidylyltransferase [Gammaproteobacteria bacterium]